MFFYSAVAKVVVVVAVLTGATAPAVDRTETT